MTDRPPAEILSEWRAAERELDGAEDEVALEVLQARIAVLREEHRVSTAVRAEAAHDLASLARFLDGDLGSGQRSLG